MNSIVTYFYSSNLPLINSLSDAALYADNKVVGYVRTELHKDCDALRALDAAKPREGETVLNSVELP